MPSAACEAVLNGLATQESKAVVQEQGREIPASVSWKRGPFALRGSGHQAYVSF